MCIRDSPDTIVENELFGHEKGAFTGAVSQHIGRCESAAKGTLFLDEIGDMPLISQAKLLRLADEGTFRRLGGKKDRTVDVRIIAATNRSLEDDVASGAFRRDLYYRLNTHSIEIPPLRERRADILPLARHFASGCSDEGWEGFTLSPAAEVYLQSEEWQGNARELKNAIERACVLADDRVLHPRDLARRRGKKTDSLNYEQAKERVLLALKRSLVTEALRRSSGNVTKAAEELGVARQTFHDFMKETGLPDKKK